MPPYFDIPIIDCTCEVLEHLGRNGYRAQSARVDPDRGPVLRFVPQVRFVPQPPAGPNGAANEATKEAIAAAVRAANERMRRSDDAANPL